MRPDGLRYGFLQVLSILILSLGVLLLAGVFLLGRVPPWFYKVYSHILLLYLVLYSLFFVLGIYISIKAVYVRSSGNMRMSGIFLRGIVLGFIILLVVSFCFINYYQRSMQERLEQCGNNLKIIGSRIEEYSRSHGAPASQKELNALLSSPYPCCPMAPEEIWSPGYEVDRLTGRFTLFCRGNYHKGAFVPRNYPRYSTEKGIVLSPR